MAVVISRGMAESVPQRLPGGQGDLLFSAARCPAELQAAEMGGVARDVLSDQVVKVVAHPVTRPQQRPQTRGVAPAGLVRREPEVSAGLPWPAARGRRTP